MARSGGRCCAATEREAEEVEAAEMGRVRGGEMGNMEKKEKEPLHLPL